MIFHKYPKNTPCFSIAMKYTKKNCPKKIAKKLQENVYRLSSRLKLCLSNETTDSKPVFLSGNDFHFNKNTSENSIEFRGLRVQIRLSQTLAFAWNVKPKLQNYNTTKMILDNQRAIMVHFVQVNNEVKSSRVKQL